MKGTTSSNNWFWSCKEGKEVIQNMETFRTKTVHLREAKIAKGMWGEKGQHELDVCGTMCHTSRSQAGVSVSTGRASCWWRQALKSRIKAMVTVGAESQEQCEASFRRMGGEQHQILISDLQQRDRNRGMGYFCQAWDDSEAPIHWEEPICLIIVDLHHGVWVS